jgi:hypothetical protein
MTVGQNIAHYKIIQKPGEPACRQSLLQNCHFDRREKSFMSVSERFLSRGLLRNDNLRVIQQTRPEGTEWAILLFKGEL